MTADRSDLYAVLGLTSRATQEEIRRAYRALVRQNHPDTRPLGDSADITTSDTTLQQTLSAYSILGDPDRRALYDQRTTPSRPAPPIRVRTVVRVQQEQPEQPPILAGPVRWHHSGR
jgi:curved DNA-binding protein CbpA